MQKKKSEAKIGLPAVGIVKPSETTKNYTSKTNLSKCREVEDKNIYFEMPSIHQNDLTMKVFLQTEDKSLKKIQGKILKFYENFKENKLADEWDLYMKKSQIINSRNLEFSEVEEFLLRNIMKLANKLNEGQLNNTFSFNRTMKSNADGLDFKDSFIGTSFLENYNRTTLVQDKVMIEREVKTSKSNLPQSRSVLQDRSIPKLSESFNLNSTNGLYQQQVLLEKKVQIYERRITQLETVLIKYQDKQKENISEKDVSTEIMEIMLTKNKYKYECEVKTMMVETLTREFNLSKELMNTYKSRLDELQSSYSRCVAENTKLREYLKYKELWYMSTEETDTWHELYQQQKADKQRCMGKIKLLKEKNKQLLNYFNMSNVVNPDQEEDKQDLDKIIKEFKEWLMIISVPKVNFQGQRGNEQQGQQFMQGNQINVKLLRPNFYIFFQAFENTLLMEKNIINIRPIQYSFFLKIRTIFDTLFTSFQLARTYKEYPSFPEFVIGFLQKYQLNSENNRLQYRRKPIENQQKITFLVNLFNKNFCNTWQCEIFKNFLFQNYYQDQIYFFLDCRNQLNGGILSSYTLGSADPISYVKLGKALKIVSKKLAPYENYIIERVKNILKSKKKIKYGESFIDKYFVLKILLQVYALEKAKSQRIFESSFKSKMRKSYITYGDFHNFMNKNFVFLSSIEIAQLYREIYSMSSGHITYKAIHYICGVKGLFIPLMMEKRMNRSPIDQSLGNDMLLLDIQNNLTKMSGHFEQTGLEHFMRAELSLNDFMRQLDFYRNNKAAFYQRLHQQKAFILKISTLLEIRSSYELTPTETVQEGEIQTQMIHLHSLLHQVDTQVHHLSRQRDKRTKSYKLLVRNFKIRIQQSILQFEKVNEQEIKKLRDQIQKNNLEQRLKQQRQKMERQILGTD